jgi:hypothetical protein
VLVGGGAGVGSEEEDAVGAELEASAEGEGSEASVMSRGERGSWSAGLAFPNS